jgi:formylglycine-generating enzyme required for sulfatase activity
MNNWKKYALAAVLLTVAGFAYVNNSHRNMPTDFRDAVIDGAALDSRFAATEQGNGTVPVPKAPAHAETGALTKGYIGGNEPSAGVPDEPNPKPVNPKPVEWVTINGGKFMMGTDSGGKAFEDAKPIHEVAIKTFAMSKTAVTVEQYAECVIKGGCTEPLTGGYCNWGVTGRQLHPINCVGWDQANQYAKFISNQPGFKGARLPSEAEWEYAATSGGKNQKYPWGNDEPTCDKAVMYGYGKYGCGKNSTWPVCSKPAGNAKVSGGELCDMAGNVWQWVQDKYQDSYNGTPTDGSAFEEGTGSFRRVLRGGSFSDYGAVVPRADNRLSPPPGYCDFSTGFRLARSR